MRWGTGIGALGIWLALGTGACGGGERAGGAEASMAACSDGIDNDADGLTDCGEPSCRLFTFCTEVDGGGPPPRDADLPDVGPPGDADIACNDPIDLVFVIDVSTSMADEVAAIRMGLDRIAAAALALTTDVQMGLVVFVDDVVAVNGCNPFAGIAPLQAELAEWQSFTSSNNQPGGAPFMNSDCPENSLDALYTAATICPWRDGATRIAIHVTDDTFVERPARLSDPFGLGTGGIPVMHTYPETVMALQNNLVRVGAFASPSPGEFCGAGSSPDAGAGFHEPYMGMPDIPSSASGRVWNIRDVRSGTLDMATAISDLIEEEHCTLF